MTIYKCSNSKCGLRWKASAHPAPAAEIITTCICGAKGKPEKKERVQNAKVN